MLCDTVSDMRTHIWPEKEKSAKDLAKIEECADEKIEALRDETGHEPEGLVGQVGKTHDNVTGLEHRPTEIIDRAIERTRGVESEAQEELSVSEVLNRVISLIRRYGQVPVMRIRSYPSLRERYPAA